MLSIFDSDRSMNRRAMLQVGGLGLGGLGLGGLGLGGLGLGGLGLGGLTLSNLLATQALGAANKKSYTTGKSVIFLLQHGGPTQFETFDPKIDVPDGVRTIGGVAPTSVPGVSFGATMGDIAKLAHRVAVIRSYSTGSGAHSIRPLVSEASQGANIGSIYSRLAGTNHSETGMPTNVALYPNSVLPDDLGPDDRFGKFTQTGTLNASYAPFAPGGGSAMQNNMKLKLPANRFHDRRSLLSSLDNLRTQLERSGELEGVEKFRQQAIDIVLRGVANAFDLSDEDPRTIARYDTGDFVRETRYRDKSNGSDKRRWYQSNARTLGRLLLLARRLCEAGCGFVTVSTRFVWDMHGDNNNLGVHRGMEAVGQPFNHAVSAFIEDCEARGLSDDILLVSTGEMGRTPKINKRGGRDHWARLAPLLLYGGGITHGQVIGKSTRDGGQPDIDPVDSDNLIATIMHTLFDVGQLRLQQDLPTDLVRFATSGTPIPGLFT